MKVALFSTYDAIGGAARAALRLHDALPGAGVASRLFVRTRVERAAEVCAVGSRLTTARHVVGETLLRLYARPPGSTFELAPLPDRVLAHATRWGADVVNVHWTGHGFVRPESLARAAAPVVWTLHDSWALTGGCHVPGECTRYRQRCGACPALGSRREHDVSRWTFARRRRALAHVDLTVVAPSGWLAARASESALLAGRRIEVIPNGLDLARYQPMPRSGARRLLGIPDDRPVVLFSAYGGSAVPHKGFDLLAEALRRLAARDHAPRLLLMGAEPTREIESLGVPVCSAGTLQDDAEIVRAICAADVVVVPSRQENLPNIVMEAHACARPVIGFRVGGIPEMIRPSEDGAVVEPFDTAALADAIEWAVGDAERWARLSAAARVGAEERWGAALAARRYAELFAELTDLSRATALGTMRARAGRHD